MDPFVLAFRIAAYVILAIWIIIAIVMSRSFVRALKAKRGVIRAAVATALSVLCFTLSIAFANVPYQLYMATAVTVDHAFTGNLEIDLIRWEAHPSDGDSGWDLVLVIIDEDLGRRDFSILDPGHVTGEDFTYYAYALIRQESGSFDAAFPLLYGATSDGWFTQRNAIPDVAPFAPGTAMLALTFRVDDADSRNRGTAAHRLFSYAVIAGYDATLEPEEQDPAVLAVIDYYYDLVG